MTAIAKIPLRQVQDVKTLLHNDEARQQLAAVAAKHMSPERMMRVVANAIRTTPKLQEAEPLSFLGALMQSASLGLEPNSSMGQAYLIPFWNGRKKVNEVQLIIGYKGYKTLAWRSGQIEAMHADVVYTDDEEWSYSYGSDMHLRHKPGSREGEKTHAYCFVKLKDGGQAFAVLPWTHIMKVRDASQNWQSAVKFGKTAEAPWKKHEDEMAAKTAVRYVFQRGDVPMSIEMADAMDVDHDTGARVDYAAFAMNPSDGPMIEGDAEEVEGDEDPIDGDDKPEEKAQPETKEKVEDKPAPEKAADDKPKRTQDAPKKHLMTRSHIESDLTDGAPAAATRAFHAADLEAMKEEAPDLFAEVDAMLTEAEKDAEA